MLQYEMKEMLNIHINKDSLYTLDYLNQQIVGLELGYMESRDRPSLISSKTLHGSDHSLKQEGIIKIFVIVVIVIIIMQLHKCGYLDACYQ